MSTAVATTPATNGTSIVPASRMESALKLSNISKRCSSELIQAAGDPILSAIVTAQAMQQIRDALTADLMRDFLLLSNSPLGFRTDRGPGSASTKEPYSDAQIKDALIQAMLRGVRPIGNEFNIIAGQCYITKEGFRRLLREFPGFANLKIVIGVPKTAGEGAVVPCSATWTFSGVNDSLECDIPVKGTGCDLLLGKAESKLLRRIYARITGSDVADVASGEDESTTVLPTETTGAA